MSLARPSAALEVAPKVCNSAHRRLSMVFSTVQVSRLSPSPVLSRTHGLSRCCINTADTSVHSYNCSRSRLHKPGTSCTVVLLPQTALKKWCTEFTRASFAHEKKCISTISSITLFTLAATVAVIQIFSCGNEVRIRMHSHILIIWIVTPARAARHYRYQLYTNTNYPKLAQLKQIMSSW